MAYDEALADRMRELLAAEADLIEMKMFGGLAFLVGGNIALAASGEGGIMVRVDRASCEATTNVDDGSPEARRRTGPRACRVAAA